MRINEKLTLANIDKRVVETALAEFGRDNIIPRIWKKDHTVWKQNPSEIANRLGWLQSPTVSIEQIVVIDDFVSQIRKAKYTHTLLLGMGGSSLAPEVFRKVFGVKQGYLDLEVLDSTHPDAVRAVREKIDTSKTLFIVSTKSGGTVETFSFMKYFYNIVARELGSERTGEHFVAITDPASKLEEIGRELNFRKVFLNDPNIGGRYSALSFFGLVPAALLGIAISKLLDRTGSMAGLCSNEKDNPGAELGIVIGEMAKSGKDKLTFILSPRIAPFGAWLEQLIAESTGKEGKGILPVDGEDVVAPEYYSSDRLFAHISFYSDKNFDGQIEKLEKTGHPIVSIRLNDLYDIGGEFFRWETATAIAGWRLGINPFDQPNVESAKVLARKMLSALMSGENLSEEEPRFKDNDFSVWGEIDARNAPDALSEFIGKNIGAGSYVAIQAYLKPTGETDKVLQELRTSIEKLFKVATTVGYGPRFLHSTGQLHKGDAGKGLFIIFTDDPISDESIPDEAGSDKSSFGFRSLIKAQALGDRQALLDSKRKVLHIHLIKDAVSGIMKLTGAPARMIKSI